MRILKVLLLTALVLASAYIFLPLPNLVEAAAIGTHRVRVLYYTAYVSNDYDLIGPGEWYFYLRSPVSNWTGSGEIIRDGPGYCNLSLARDWSISGGASTWCETWAREKDPLGWHSGSDSVVHFTLPFPATIPGTYTNKLYATNNGVTHYIRYYIYNTAPTSGTILVEPTTSKDKSGETSIYRNFPTTFLAKNFLENEGDAIIYEWKVDGVLQTSKTGRMAALFSTAGSHTIQVRAKDSLGAYSSWKSKTISTAMYTYYYRFAYHECTYYASLEFDKYGYDGVKAASPGIDWGGNAGNWLTNAKAKGWATSTSSYSPQKGAIIVWKGGTWGHVAVVISYNTTHIRIAEMNWPLNNTKVEVGYFRMSNVNRGSYTFAGYIYPYKT